MSDYYDREGKSIDLHEWSRLHSDIEYKRVLSTVVGDKQVSTVWLGLNHNWGDGPPEIFETMVFPKDSLDEEFCERYATEAEAVAGHHRVVAHVYGTFPSDDEAQAAARRTARIAAELQESVDNVEENEGN